MREADHEQSGPTGVRRITVPASVDMVNVLGPRDEFLRILERDLAADVHVRGNEFTFTGEPTDVTVAAEVLTELVTIVRTGQGLTADAVERVVKMTVFVASTEDFHAQPAVANGASQLIGELFRQAFDNPWLARGDDGAVLPELAPGESAASLALGLGLQLQAEQALPPIRHTFTHFRLELTPLLCQVAPVATAGEPGWEWLPWQDMATAALPTPLRKLLQAPLF